MGEENGAHDRSSGPQERASGREREKKRETGLRVTDKEADSDIGSGMAKW